jgi:hypothetical protein
MTIYTVQRTHSIYFINNMSSCSGLGTFESPFCSFTVAENRVPSGPVIVYVFEGNSSLISYNTNSYLMKPDQTLQGSGIPMTLGGVTIPAMTSGSPILTNPGGIGIELANRVTVRGLKIQNTSGTSLYGSTLTGPIRIDQNTILNSGGYGIEITDHSGDIIVSNNIVSEVVNNGISLNHATAPGNAWIFGNTVLNPKQTSVLIRLNHPSAFGWIANNYFSRNALPDGSAFDVGTEVTEGSLIIESNTMQSNTQYNIHALDGFHVIRNNTIVATSPISGPAILYNCTDSGISSREVYIFNNQVKVVTSTTEGIRATNTSAANASFYAELKGNIVQTTDPTKGLRVDLFNPGSACVSIKDNHAASFSLDGTSGPINVQETQSQYQSQNQASTGFTQSGTVNFGSDCTAP